MSGIKTGSSEKSGMLFFVGRRIFIALGLLLVMSFVTFMLMRLTPGNYLDTMRLDPQISPETLARYEQRYQLDKPPVVQYFFWLTGVVRGDLGFSFYYNVPVAKVIAPRVLNTLVLSLSAFLFTWLVALPLGIYAALRQGSWVDRIIQGVAYVLLSVPGFLVALLLLLWASRTGFLPLGGAASAGHEHMGWLARTADSLYHLVLPTLALSLGSIAALQKLMRGSLLEVLGRPFMSALRAKGISEGRVVYVHAVRNALNPLITLLGYEFSGLLSGAALMEIVLSWPGLGALMLTAVRSKDIYLVMASMLMGGVMFIAGNLLADILLAKADPRIRFGGKK
jgi:peptide/nickel transport system permease protein